jgi:predicted O-methyltransferase YrrM
MEHFFENIEGWFNSEDLYRERVAVAEDGARFVEIGAWKGRSAAFMAVEIANSGKQIHFHVIDNFRGSEEHKEHECVRSRTLMQEFLQNMLPVSGHHSTLVADSAAAADYFANASIDFCYIDAAHDYESVKRDILAWLPKMKPGATLAGDDYKFYPGVKQAVDEVLGPTATGGMGDNVWRYTCPLI